MTAVVIPGLALGATVAGASAAAAAPATPSGGAKAAAAFDINGPRTDNGSASSAVAPAARRTAGTLAAQPLSYFIKVRTADFPNAGTDATIRMKVYGTLRDSPGYINLDNSQNNFERGRTDGFGDFTWFDIGRPDFIGVHKYGDGSDWFPEEATIYVTNEWAHTFDSYNCPMSANFGGGDSTQWFDCP